MATHFAAVDKLLSEGSCSKNAEKALTSPGSELADLESRLGLGLPAAIREWYERPDGIALLYQCSNGDPALRPSAMQVAESTDGRRVIFQQENQGCCEWAFALDAADDPGVFVRFEDGPWQSCDCTFSGFVFGRVFDWENSWAEDERRLSGPMPDASAQQWLDSTFTAQPSNKPWGTEILRYTGEGSRLVISSNPIWPAESVEWAIAADSFERMDGLVEALLRFCDEEI